MRPEFMNDKLIFSPNLQRNLDFKKWALWATSQYLFFVNYKSSDVSEESRSGTEMLFGLFHVELKPGQNFF